MSDDPSPERALDLLGDPYVRAILTATHATPMTASALAEEIDAAPSTVYDRIDDLADAGFLAETTRTDGAGNHYAEYHARLDRIGVEVSEDGFDLVTSDGDRDEAAARLHALWSDLR